MRACTMITTCSGLGRAVFGRPHVSDDNPYSELCSGLEAHAGLSRMPLPTQPRVGNGSDFVDWYNKWTASAPYGFVTPNERHWA